MARKGVYNSYHEELEKKGTGKTIPVIAYDIGNTYVYQVANSYQYESWC